MHITQALHQQVQTERDRVAIIFGERRTTWGLLADRVGRLAHALIKNGVGRGDRVAIIALNSDRYIEIYYAVAWIGAVVVPGNIRWSEAEHLYGMEDSSPSLLFVDRAFCHFARPIGERYSIPIVFADDGAVPDELLSYEHLIEEHDPIEDRCGRDDDLCGIFYTGGTTGHPKGVMLSHKSLVLNALYGNATGGRYDPQTCMLHAAPFFHMAGYGSFLATTMGGGTHVIIAAFDPEAVVKAFVEQGANSALFVPTMFLMLAEYLDRHPADLSDVTRLSYGASPISEALLTRAMSLFPNARFYQGYGQSELGPVATCLLPEHHLPGGDRPAMLRSAGRAYVGVDVRIAGDNLQEVPRGTVGEIIVRHDGIMSGYWKKPEQTAATIVDGWVRTGDGGYMDADGFVFLVDRIKDMIVSGGENIFSAEVENALCQHPAVLECAVIGLADDRWGEVVHAIVRLREGEQAAGDELMTHCRALIAGYKCPRTVEFRNEAFPLSGAGKILKRELRDAYKAGAK